MSNNRRDLLQLGFVGALGAALTPPAWSQDWPRKPLRILVGYAPGGTADAYARAIGLYYQKVLKQTVVVENRPGGAGMIAMGELARSAPDGYTLALSPTSVYWGNRAFYKKMPFDPDRDVQPYTLLPVGSTILAVPVSSRCRTLAEFIAWAKDKPASAGTYAQGSTAHIMIDVLNRHYGTQITPVHYKGEAPMWVDAAAGTIDAAFGTYASFAALFDANRLRPIAQSTLQRSPKLPETPTFVESGIEDQVFSLDPWTSMVAPAHTPSAILERLAALAHEFADTAEGIRFRQQFGIASKPTLFAETQARARTDAPIWIDMAKGLGLPPQ